MTKTCPNCGNEFEALVSRKKYCSASCAMSFIRRMALTKVYKRTCIVCGEDFESNNQQRFICSKKCRKERQRQMHERRMETLRGKYKSPARRDRETEAAESSGINHLSIQHMSPEKIVKNWSRIGK